MKSCNRRSRGSDAALLHDSARSCALSSRAGSVPTAPTGAPGSSVPRATEGPSRGDRSEALPCRSTSPNDQSPGAAAHPPVPERPGSICAAWHRVLRDVEAGSGPEESWRELVELIHPLMTAWARHATLRHRQLTADVEGIVQDVYVRLLGGNCLAMRRCRAHTERQIRAYLRCVCDNIATDRTRRNASQRRGGGRLVSVEDWSDDRIRDDQPDGCRRGHRRLAPIMGADDPEQRALARCRLRTFERDLDECAAAGRHPERNAWIFRQAVVHRRRTTDIAAAVDLRCSSVDSVVARLRQRLELRGWTFPRRT